MTTNEKLSRRVEKKEDPQFTKKGEKKGEKEPLLCIDEGSLFCEPSKKPAGFCAGCGG